MTLQSLLGSDETVVDSVIVSGLIALLTLCGLAIYQAVLDPHSFSPAVFGSGAAAIIGAAGAVKTVRERLKGTE